MDPRLGLLIASLPHLAALRDGASLTAAAATLGIGQSAMSHRLRSVEEGLGASLFRRTSRRLEATPDGAALTAAAARALAELTGALASLDRRRQGGRLVLSLPSSLALKWLVPRLDDLARACPVLDLALLAEDRLTDLAAGEADVAIRFAVRPTPGLHATRLAREQVVAVIRPGARPDLPRLTDTAALADGTGLDWAAWAAHCGLALAEGPERRFNRADVMLQAAIAGQGRALGRGLVIADDLATGLLAADPAIAVDLDAGYWFVCPADRAADPIVAALRDWIAQAMRQTAADLAHHLAR
jgi:LysR family glycine cleavage system transcriptional activator